MEALAEIGQIRVVIVPLVVTGGKLFRGWLGASGDVEIEPAVTAHVALRPGLAPTLKRCIITTEAGLADLTVRADRTTKLLLPRP